MGRQLSFLPGLQIGDAKNLVKISGPGRPISLVPVGQVSSLRGPCGVNLRTKQGPRRFPVDGTGRSVEGSHVDLDPEGVDPIEEVPVPGEPQGPHLADISVDDQGVPSNLPVRHLHGIEIVLPTAIAHEEEVIRARHPADELVVGRMPDNADLRTAGGGNHGDVPAVRVVRYGQVECQEGLIRGEVSLGLLLLQAGLVELLGGGLGEGGRWG